MRLVRVYVHICIVMFDIMEMRKPKLCVLGGQNMDEAGYIVNLCIRKSDMKGRMT